MADAASQSAYEKLTEEFRSTQSDLSSFIEARQKLESQLQENKIVQKEFSILDDHSKIYKLIGPVLIPQDKGEAVLNVDKRLEFIESEIKRIEGQINDTRAKSDKKRAELISFQAQLQEKARS
ncbi:Prefoldin [Lipomyces starkeyi]